MHILGLSKVESDRYKINRYVNKKEVYFSFTYIMTIADQSRTDLDDQAFIWDRAFTFTVAPTSLFQNISSSSNRATISASRKEG